MEKQKISIAMMGDFFPSHPLYASMHQQYIIALDLYFAWRYVPDIHHPAFCFLAIFSSVLRYGHPYMTLGEAAIPGISKTELHSYYQALPKDLLSHLFVIRDENIYLRKLYDIREHLFHKLTLLSSFKPKYTVVSEGVSLLSEEQHHVLTSALSSCFSIICGGPGTGKTFLATQIIRAVLHADPQWRIAVVSPTGKATSHIRQLLARDGISEDRVMTQTIHSYLRRAKTWNQSVDLLLVDEGSMVTLDLLHGLVNTLSGRHGLADSLIILGDPNQLPPIGVGAGNPLRDLLHHFQERSLYLSHSYRAKTSQIQMLSTSFLTHGEIPFSPLPNIKEAIVQMKQELIQAHMSQTQLCVLTPMRYGVWGYLSLNGLIFREMKKTHPHIPIPIMVTEKQEVWGLHNGDTGFLCPQTQRLFFSGGRSLQAQHFSHYVHNYATSIHKSQGSEYDRVLVILPKGSEVFDRAILYTAITRAKHSVTLWVDKELHAFIKKPRSSLLGSMTYSR